MNRRLEDAKAGMASVYQRQADWWHGNRDRSLREAKWLDRFSDSLTGTARLLDLGCGTGDPIARYLSSNKVSVVGVDASPKMIDIAKSETPSGEWHVADMRDLPDFGDFDGIVSWDAFFHLSPDEQRTTLPKLCKIIRPGGALLITVGHDEGETDGWINGEVVYHGSLSPAEYHEILKANGFSDIVYDPDDPDVGGRWVILATERNVARA